MTNSKGKDQIIAVLDTQVDALHPEILGHVTTGKPSLLGILGLGDLNLVGKSLLGPLLTNGAAKNHGTFVSAIVLRAAPQAKVMPIAVLNAAGRGSTAQVAAGIRIAADRGADVINMSLHTTADTRVLREAVQYALSKNVVLVAAYGNEGRQNPGNIYPANYPGVIAVMSVDGQDQRASFSNYGRADLVAAPGVNVISAYQTLSLLYGIGSGHLVLGPVGRRRGGGRARSPRRRLAGPGAGPPHGDGRRRRRAERRPERRSAERRARRSRRT